MFCGNRPGDRRDIVAQREQNFDIEGMSCAACVRRVEQRVSGLEGVEDVAVNLATERMGVRFDPVMVDEEGIVAVVTKAGYGARLREVEEVVARRVHLPSVQVAQEGAAGRGEQAAGEGVPILGS